MGDETENALINLRSKTDAELRQALDDLCQEEARLSFERRVLHGKIDILRAELADRLKSRHEKGEQLVDSFDINRLSEILARGGAPNSRRSRELLND